MSAVVESSELELVELFASAVWEVFSSVRGSMLFFLSTETRALWMVALRFAPDPESRAAETADLISSSRSVDVFDVSVLSVLEAFVFAVLVLLVASPVWLVNNDSSEDSEVLLLEFCERYEKRLDVEMLLIPDIPHTPGKRRY
jgi:hypothetical protein